MSDYSSDALATPPVSAVERGRRAYRRKQTTRSVLISLVSTIVVAGILIAVVVNSDGWEATRNTFFNGKYFVQAFPQVLSGLWLNIRILLVVLYLIGFGIPALNPTTRIPTAVLGTVALVLTYSSYVAEVLRAGLDSVHPSQRYAARSLGLTHGQTLRMIIVPQAIRKVTPALMNDFISMQKDVGLISVLGAVDAIRSAQMVQAKTYNMTSYVVAGLLFIVLSFPFIRLSDWYTARLRKREQMGGTV